MKLAFFVLRVADLERSRAFYACLGLELVAEKHGAGPLHYSCSLDGVVMELYPASPQQPLSNVRLGFQATKETVERLNMLLEEPPRLIRESDDAEVFLVRDPDENAIELEVARHRSEYDVRQRAKALQKTPSKLPGASSFHEPMAWRTISA